MDVMGLFWRKKNKRSEIPPPARPEGKAARNRHPDEDDPHFQDHMEEMW